MSKSDSRPADLAKLSANALRIKAEADDASAMIFLGVHLVGAIDRNTRAINHMTAALRTEGSLEDQDAMDAAEAEARAGH